MAAADSLRSSIEKSNNAIHVAMMKKDVKSLKKILKDGTTPNFKYSENGQTMGFDQMFAMMSMSVTQMNMTKADSTILKVSEKGNVGSASSKHMMAGTMVGQDKKKHTMTFTGVSEDSFVKVGGKWKQASMAWKSQTMTMDGKVMDPTKMAPSK